MLSKIDVQKFNTLIETNALINSNYTDLNSLLVHILDSATRLCEGEASNLLLVNKETQELHFEIFLGKSGENANRYTIKMGEGIAGWVALHNRSMVIADNDERSVHDTSVESSLPYKTMMAAPLRVKDECLGVIELINKISGRALMKTIWSGLRFLPLRPVLPFLMPEAWKKRMIK